MMAFLALFAVFTQFVKFAAGMPGTGRYRSTDDTKGKRPRDDAGEFIQVQNGQMVYRGKPFLYLGTTAYWLQHLSDENLNMTLSDIAARNITVVRTWAFNDVPKIPDTGAWFQLIQPNGTIINSGPDGLERLDVIVDMAEEKGLFIQFVLTNNWNPDPAEQSDASRGSLSSDYGGMDAYIRAYSLTTHDQFYTNETLIKAFENYLQAIVPRYINRGTVLGWEIANDARCNSTLPSSPSCQTSTLTRWHALIADTLKELDPNHMVAAGTHGFMCGNTSTASPPCLKLFPILNIPKTTETPIAQATSDIAGMVPESDHRPPTSNHNHHGKRNIGLGPAFDGSAGVDSLDIANIPNISFSTFQLFPDQNNYGVPTLDGRSVGVTWIAEQVALAKQLGKPCVMTGFGLLSQGNIPNFVAFDGSHAIMTGAATSGPTDDQVAEIYGSWIDAGINNTIAGMIHYQWSQSNLVATQQSGASKVFVPGLPSFEGTTSPQDGYRINATSVLNTLQAGSLKQMGIELLETTTTVTSMASPTGINADTQSHHHTVQTGLIIGVVVGITGLSIALLCFVTWYRRHLRARRPKSMESMPIPVPFVPVLVGSTSIKPTYQAKEDSDVRQISDALPAAIPFPSRTPEAREATPQAESAPPRFIHHEDSGMRLRNRDAEAIVDVPPSYTFH